MDSSKLEELFTKSAVAAMDGTLTDADRAGLYQIALGAAADELYRLEHVVPGCVKVEPLLLMHQIGLLCDPNVTREKLIDNMSYIARKAINAAQAEDGGPSEPDAGQVRGAELGSTEGNS